MAEPTNDAVSDERLCQHLLMIDEEMCSQEPATVLRLAHEAADALNRRSVTSQASEGLTDRLQAFIWQIEPKPQVVTPSKTQKIARRLRSEVVEELRSILSSASPSKRVERLETASVAKIIADNMVGGTEDFPVLNVASFLGDLIQALGDRS